MIVIITIIMILITITAVSDAKDAMIIDNLLIIIFIII